MSKDKLKEMVDVVGGKQSLESWLSDLRSQLDSGLIGPPDRIILELQPDGTEYRGKLYIPKNHFERRYLAR